MKMTQAEYDELLRRNPALHPEVCAPKQKPPTRVPLDNPPQGEAESLPFFTINFEVHSARPADWDNYWTKAMQDALRYAGILHEDKWDVLKGSCESQKVHREEEEKTVITISKSIRKEQA